MQHLCGLQTCHYFNCKNSHVKVAQLRRQCGRMWHVTTIYVFMLLGPNVLFHGEGGRMTRLASPRPGAGVARARPRVLVAPAASAVSAAPAAVRGGSHREARRAPPASSRPSASNACARRRSWGGRGKEKVHRTPGIRNSCGEVVYEAPRRKTRRPLIVPSIHIGGLNYAHGLRHIIETGARS